jgi:hypothetical protein
VSLRGPPCAHGILGIPFGEVRDNWDAVAKLEDRLTRHGVKRDREAPAAQKRLRWKLGIFRVGAFCSFSLAQDPVNEVLLLTCFTLPIGMEHGTDTNSMARLN